MNEERPLPPLPEPGYGETEAMFYDADDMRGYVEADRRAALSQSPSPEGDEANAHALLDLLNVPRGGWSLCGRIHIALDQAKQAALSQSQAEAPADLRRAAQALLDACYAADGQEELAANIDGSLLDAVSDALEARAEQPAAQERAEPARVNVADMDMRPGVPIPQAEAPSVVTPAEYENAPFGAWYDAAYPGSPHNDTTVGLMRIAFYAALAAQAVVTPSLSEALDALAELFAQVWGECPSLLNEDSGGDAQLSLRIEAILATRSKP